MTPKTELNRLRIELDPDELLSILADKAPFRFKFQYDSPLIVAEAEIDPRSLHLEIQEAGPLWDIEATVKGRAENPDWEVEVTLSAAGKGSFPKSAFHWSDDQIITLLKAELLPESEFLIDGRPVELTHTLNALLGRQKTRLISDLPSQLRNRISVLSQEYFGNDLLVKLLDRLHFHWESRYDDEKLRVRISAEELETREEREEREENPPYFYLEMPGSDFEYLMTRLDFPVWKFQNYHFMISAVKVTGKNTVSVRLHDHKKNTTIEAEVFLRVEDEKIYPKVERLDIRGLNLLKSALFQVLKSAIVKYIERQVIDPAIVTADLQKEWQKKYPFLLIQDGQPFRLKNLDFDHDRFYIFLYFLEPVSVNS